ncbi:MAG: molybdopterin converting factor subunit 1 [Rhodospirillales bacterium]|jgi:molybdopterin synthase sulfur carrier subunit|nr:molybdopterin converting factor subunit 1 [Rhodospirillales bacterium]MDP7651355.1 molybdopterin converting factor subunit 1 [Rhodospirillales bacterium]|tara:strand:- start:321 stop:572 length:252 start_codon:yes stop_codon:yes gene_type:complete
MKIVYFAWLREKTGCAEEEVSPPESVTDVRGLVEWLCSRGDGYAEAFADLGPVRVAVNLEYVKLDQAVGPDDEVAFFPPVTGG